ncbi:MAG: LysR family transcriptional regulator [Puniceicoccaceae bacterium]
MELRHLRYFVMAAEEGNISRASDRLNVSQPAVSRQIKDLEEELGVQLFNREPNGLSLTEAGKSALAHAREVLRQSNTMVEAMEALASRRKSQSIKVGFLPTALPGLLTNALRTFNNHHQAYCVQIHEMSPTQQEEALRNGEIDLGLIGEACPEIKRDFHVDTIRRTEVAVIVPDNHPLAARKSVDLVEFAGDTFVTLHEERFPGRKELMADMFSKAGIQPDVTMRAGGLSELLGLVGAGSGVALAPADLGNLPHPGVVFLKLKKPQRAMLFSAAWRKTGDLTGVKALVDLIQQESGLS